MGGSASKLTKRAFHSQAVQFPMSPERMKVPQTIVMEKCIPGRNQTNLLRPHDDMPVADFLRQISQHPKFTAENQWTPKDIQRALYQFFHHRVDTVHHLRTVSQRVWNEMDLAPGIADAIRIVLLGVDNPEYSTKFSMASYPKIDLCAQPAYRAETLGFPLPNSPHATSVSMPLWEHVIGYEEGKPEIISKFQLGYPRFFIHPFVTRLIKAAEREFANKGEECWVFPSINVANRCVTYLHSKIGFGAMSRVRVNQYPGTDIFVVTFPSPSRFHVQQFWQHFGDIVSSRQALAAMEGTSPSEYPISAQEAKMLIKERIAQETGELPENVYLYPTGMSAISQSLQIAQSVTPGAKSVQMGFPYLDVLKIQTVIGPGNHFFPNGCNTDLDSLRAMISKKEPMSSVMCEFPGNPLLSTPNILSLSHMLREKGIPLIIDDTIASFGSIKSFPYADVIVSSLTKWFSGTGDVMGGSVVLNRNSPFYEKFKEIQNEHYEDIFYGADAQVLEVNSRDFSTRIKKTNETAKIIADYFQKHKKVDKVYFPKVSEIAPELRKDGDGVGGLMSIVLKDAPNTSQKFYDVMPISKGPSLGTKFSLACPYTMLAHYDEMDWAESVGISRWLIRLSIGVEEPEELIRRFETAFAQI